MSPKRGKAERAQLWAETSLPRKALIKATYATRPTMMRMRGRWYFRKAERVGSNPQVVGRPLIKVKELVVGNDVRIWSIYRRTYLAGRGRIELGDHTWLNSGAIMLSETRITLEDWAGVGAESYITDSDFHFVEDRPMTIEPVVLAEGCWVGIRTIILPGIRIGARAMVLANSIVTEDVPDETMVGGIPARTIRKIKLPPGQKAAWNRKGRA